ncbi:MAG: type II toxin-antitoxin system VapC family toxin [Candidatus Aenigmarchaeota archaeon]|nr:type II toxin-antitoxin system VapC family toxin [Candidatus Aenigmarchaeota archaeon]
MPFYYLDTSAWVKRYITENGSDFVDQLFDGKMSNEKFLTSIYTGLEMQISLQRARHMRKIDLLDFNRIMRNYGHDVVTDNVEIVSIDDDIIRSASVLSGKYPKLGEGDTIHLATALDLEYSEGNDLIMITADRDLLEASIAENLFSLHPVYNSSRRELRRIRTGRRRR